MRSRFILQFFILLILVPAVCGCTMNSKDKVESYNQIVSEMRDYLSQKYGPSYVYPQDEGFFFAGWDYPYDLCNMAVELDGASEVFSVERHKTDTGYVFEDNYFGLLIRPGFEEMVLDLASEYFETANVYAYLTQNYPDNLTSADQLEDLLSLEDLECITVIITVPEEFDSIENFNTAAEAFINKWGEKKIYSAMRVIYLDNETFEHTNRTNVTDVLVDVKLAEYYKLVK